MGGRGSGGPGKISMEDGSLPRQLTAAPTVWDSGLHDQTHEAPETIIVWPSATDVSYRDGRARMQAPPWRP